MDYFQFAESYIAHNFGSASNYLAGMSFTNLAIAIPIIATILLIIINKFRPLINKKYIQSKFLGCQFQLITVTMYIIGYCTSVYVFDLKPHIILPILGYIPFMFLVWCIYNECTYTSSYCSTSEIEYINNFILAINNKVQALERESWKGNILINGSWGSGKSYMVQNHLLKSIPAIYLSCTDFTDLHELNTALIKKTNNCFIRFLMMLSLSRLIAIIGKTELKEYIGLNKVIVFDEFERLVDYNKIDPMHIVSFIQYLNDEKNCICILIANEDHLNEANQFNNVREKLISLIYHYKLPFDNVFALIEKKWQDRLDKSSEEQIIKYSLKTNSSGNKDEFSDVYLELKRRYNLDNNIRMLKHTYKKINEVYQSSEKYIKFDDFKSSNNDIKITKEEFFALLFSNVLDLINPLYYLYLKNPYNLDAIETLAIIYRNYKPESNVKDHVGSNDNKTISNNKSNDILKYYLDKDSIQSLALSYHVDDNISYENKENKLYDKSYDLNYIITNQIFENINMILITNYLGNEKIVSELLPIGEHGKTLRENIKNYMRLFRDKFCESEDQKFITDYFERINVLEQRFDRLIAPSVDEDFEQEKKLFDISIVTDYVAYCQYIDEKYPRGNPKNIRPVSYRRVAYINALIIQYLSDNSLNNTNDIIIGKITEFYNTKSKEDLIPIVYELTAQLAKRKNKIKEYIELISQIVNKLLESNQREEDYLILLKFMYHSYNEIIKYLNHTDIKLCNEKMAELLAKNINDKNYCDSFFESYSNLNQEIIKFNSEQKEIITDNIIKGYVQQISDLIKKTYSHNSIIALNKMNESFNSIKSFLDEDTIKLCNQNMIDLINLKHINEKSFLQTLFINLANLNDDITPESIPDDSFNHLLTKIQDIYKRRQDFIQWFKNEQNYITKMVISKLQEELNKQNYQETE